MLKKYRGALRSIESLNKLDVTHTIRCQKHVKNCALQNVFKIQLIVATLKIYVLFVKIKYKFFFNVRFFSYSPFPVVY